MKGGGIDLADGWDLIHGPVRRNQIYLMQENCADLTDRPDS